MTKEELKQEAEEYASKGGLPKETYLFGAKVIAYLAGAEPREKQIEILSKHILELQADKGRLTDKVRELEAQIEKMKVCQNCDNWNWKHNKCEKKLKGDCFKHSKWVMRNF